jgi:hypothetical protein
MAISGTPKFSALDLKEMSAEISGTSIALSGKAAFVNPSNNATHGWTKAEGSVWSKETIEALLELRAQMEKDLARLHFEGQSVASDGSRPLELGGLGEHLGQDADQV